MRDSYTYYSLAFFIAFINFLACGQRFLDKDSPFKLKLSSVLLYILMLTILFICPLFFGHSVFFLAAGLVAGYLHFFHDMKILKR